MITVGKRHKTNTTNMCLRKKSQYQNEEAAASHYKKLLILLSSAQTMGIINKYESWKCKQVLFRQLLKLHDTQCP